MVVLEADGYRVVRVEPEHVDPALPFLEPILRRAVPYTAGHESVESLLGTLRQGARPWQLWLVVHGSQPVGGFITTLERAGADLVGTFEILAGVEAQAWIAPLIHRFEQYLAFMYGVTAMRIVGRRGWERFLAQHGYHASHFITAKRLLPQLADIQTFLPQEVAA